MIGILTEAARSFGDIGREEDEEEQLCFWSWNQKESTVYQSTIAINFFSSYLERKSMVSVNVVISMKGGATETDQF